MKCVLGSFDVLELQVFSEDSESTDLSAMIKERNAKTNTTHRAVNSARRRGALRRRTLTIQIIWRWVYKESVQNGSPKPLHHVRERLYGVSLGAKRHVSESLSVLDQQHQRLRIGLKSVLNIQQTLRIIYNVDSFKYLWDICNKPNHCKLDL